MVKQKKYLILSLLVLVAFFFTTTGSVEAKTLVDEVRINSPRLDLSTNESLQLIWTMAEPCTYSVHISDMEGNIVKSLADKATAAQSGAVTLTWDGLDDQGISSPAGLYFPVIKAKSKRMGSYTYNPTALPWGEKMPNEPEYDSSQQLVSFSLDRPFYGRVLAGNMEGGPIYSVIAPWQVFTKGSHEIAWNGMDSDNVNEVVNLAGSNITLDGYTLPENSFLLTGSRTDDKEKNTPPGKAKAKKIPVFPSNGAMASPYSMFSKTSLPDPDIVITLNGGTYRKDDIPEVKGKASFGVDLADKAGLAMSATKERLEVVIFFDTKLYTETYLNKLPAKLDVDTTKLSNGEHYITINVLAPDYRLGTFSGRLTIAN